MAAESLLGGSAQDVITRDDVRQVLDFALGGSTSANVVQLDGGTKISGTNPNTAVGVPEANTLVAADQPLNVTIENGVAQIDVALPAGVTVATKGLSEAASVTQAEQYLHSLLEQAIPKENSTPEALQVRDAIEKSINTATNVLKAVGVEQAVVQVVTLGASSATTGETGEVRIEGQADQAEHFTLLVGNLGTNNVVNVANVEAVSVLGEGRVKTETAATVIGDLANQVLEGSTGNDTLIGGGGSDTLIGGGGQDVFGFNNIGHYRIEGAGKDDQFTFLFDGITSLDQLAQYVTNMVETAEGVTFEFGPSASITLVGLKASDITADMIKFGL